MAAFVVSTAYTGDAFGVALAASGIATRLGTGNVFRVTGNIAIQASVEMHGYTLQFANGFGIYTNTSNGYLKGGFKENGNIISPLNLIFEGKSFSAVNITTDANSWIRGGSRWETYGLNITYQKITDHTDTCLSDNTKTYTQVFESLSVDVLQPAFDHYIDVNFKTGSTISFLKLRNSNIRLLSGSPTFVVGGYSWLRGQSGQANLKLLSDVQTVSGFIPVYPNTLSGVETSSSTFTANTIEFQDSQLDGDLLLAYPPNDASVNRRIKRTFKFAPKNLTTGADVTSFSTRITANRKLFGGYAGTAGQTVLYDFYAASTGASQVVEVYHATNHNTSGTGAGGYKNATVYRLDKEITLKMRKAGYKEYTAATDTYRGEYVFAPSITPDALYSNTATNIATVITAAQMYDVVQQYLEANLGTDIVLSRNGTTVTTTHNVLMNSNATALVSLSGNNLTIKAGTFVDNLTTTGTVTFSNGAKITGALEDSAGVRVTVKAPTPTTEFNISARYGTTTFTNLGFFTATGEITFTVPKGQPLDVAIWAFGYSTYVTTIDTTEGGSIFTAPLAINTAVDTTLNVDSYLSKIALSLDESGATPKLVLTVNEPMTVSGIELGKAITHKVAGLQVALTAALTFGDVTPLDIEPTEILNNLPAFSLVVGAAVTASQRVYFDFFINTAPALAIDPTYVLNPIRADGNQVQILRVKPDVDPAQMAAGVIAGGVATSAQVLARPTLAEIEVAGGKLDTAMKAAKSAKLNTMG